MKVLKDSGQVLQIMDAKLNELHNPRDTWFMKGLAEGAAWACVGLEVRMEEEP